QRSPALQSRPRAKDKGAPVVPARGTGQPALPRRKPLPHVKALGARPAKPQRPPVVDLEKFGAAAHPGTPSLLSLQQLPNRHLPPRRDEGEVYDDVEPVGLLGRGQGFPLPTVSQPP
ncbi:hypothetical protein N324_03726, partial [Chlamydotis macqueenii]